MKKYRLEFRVPSYSGSDEYEGSRRAHMSSYETSETFEASDEGAAILRAIEIMQKRSTTFQGKTYNASAIALYQVIDLSAFAHAR